MDILLLQSMKKSSVSCKLVFILYRVTVTSELLSVSHPLFPILPLKRHFVRKFDFGTLSTYMQLWHLRLLSYFRIEKLVCPCYAVLLSSACTTE
jgi:hypothetical protein